MICISQIEGKELMNGIALRKSCDLHIAGVILVFSFLIHKRPNTADLAIYHITISKNLENSIAL